VSLLLVKKAAAKRKEKSKGTRRGNNSKKGQGRHFTWTKGRERISKRLRITSSGKDGFDDKTSNLLGVIGKLHSAMEETVWAQEATLGEKNGGKSRITTTYYWKR